MEWELGIILLGLIAIFALPAWIPVLRKKPMTPMFKWALAFTALGQLIQATFVGALTLKLLTLEYSWRFGPVGLIAALIGGLLGFADLLEHGVGGGCMVTDVLSGLIWLFLMSVH